MGEVDGIEADAKASHEKLCREWAIASCKGDQRRINKATEFRKALVSMLGESNASVAQIDAAIKAAGERLAAAKTAKDAESAKQAEQDKKEAAAYREKMQALWVTPYSGGTIYCGQEVWSYTADGVAKSGNKVINFNGETVWGDVNGNVKWFGPSQPLLLLAHSL